MVDTSLNLVQRASDGQELALVGRRRKDDGAAGLSKELVERIGFVSKNELVLTTVDCQLAKSEVALELSSEAFDLGTSLLGRSPLSGDQNVLVGARHELNLARVGFLGGRLA
jgi:hypothetical protein